jgi:ADP-heptose:LPS heptosyltransferase
LLVRAGGIGDLLFMTPLIRTLSMEFGAKVYVCTCREYFGMLEASAHVAGVIEYPPITYNLDGFEHVLFMENVIEGNPEAETMHAVDLMLQRANLGTWPVEDKGCEVWGRGIMPMRANRGPKLRDLDSRVHIGFHATASQAVRRYSRFNQLLELIHNTTDWHLHLYGAPNDILFRAVSDRVHNHTLEGLSIVETFEHMRELDGFVGIDSALLHAAGGMGLPSVGIFGSFKGELRCKYHPSVTVLQATGGCAPCFWHGRMGKFPAKGPCVAANRCVVIDSIPPEMVLEALRDRLFPVLIDHHVRDVEADGAGNATAASDSPSA